MMNRTIRRLFRGLCASSLAHPWAWFLVSLALCVPAWHQAQKVRLDTNLIRLLPQSSPAARWTRTLDSVVGDGTNFSVLFEGDDRERLIAAVRRAAARAEKLPEVAAVEYAVPRDFLSRWRYALVPEYYLDRVLDELISWEAEFSPAGVNLLGDDRPTAAAGPAGGPTRADLERQLLDFGSRKEFYESEDGRVFGMIVRPRSGLGSFADVRRLHAALVAIAEEEARAGGLWGGVGGTLRNKVTEYEVIRRDLNVSGAVSGTLIVAFLVVSFRTLAVIPFLLYPVVFGLLATYALVPALVGSLNTITAFLLLVLFGAGVENPIHLMKRFQYELLTRPCADALHETFASTAPSVIVSGVTTAGPLFLLTVSEFRGFSEFGLIAGTGILLMMAVLLIVMPSCLVLGHRLGMIGATHPSAQWGIVPPRRVSAATALLVLAAAAAAAVGLRFDYDFSHLTATVPESTAVKERHEKVYRQSVTPAAIYVARDECALDALLEVLEQARRRPGSRIGRITSRRDFAPTDAAAAKRRELIALIQDELTGKWVNRVKSRMSREWIADVRSWSPPGSCPTLEDLPPALARRFEARDGSGQLIVGIYPTFDRKQGRESSAFTKELYALTLPEGVRGPVGETPLFSEILWVVHGEGPWLVLLTLGGLVLLIFAHTRSLRATVVIVTPLVSGVLLALGVMAVSGMRLNFYNIVVIPTLLGMGVDFGVHYYRRWEELGRDIRETQRELLEPLTTVTISAILGYSGMIFAIHPGLQSIGIAASLGLAGNLVSYTMLVPGMLRLLAARDARR